VMVLDTADVEHLGDAAKLGISRSVSKYTMGRSHLA
jgi:hypothetical protein